MLEEIREIEVAQGRMGLGGPLRKRGEERVRDQRGRERIAVFDAIAYGYRHDYHPRWYLRQV